MQIRLEQRIFGSTSRINFETLASTRGIPDPARRQLQTHEQRYPNRSTHEGEPPYIFRGYQLDAGQIGCGVTLLRYVGANMNKAEGNYIAHSYIIPDALLQEQEYNLPWITAHLPCRYKYQPERGVGAAELETYELTINFDDQFRMAAFVIRELGRPTLGLLLRNWFDQLHRGQPLDLSLPAPDPALAEVYKQIYNAQIAPGPDALRLFRLAGIKALLPAAFKSDVSFSINEDTGEPYAIRVSRKISPPAVAEIEPWPWLDACAQLAEQEVYAELLTMCGWLSRLLPRTCSPSLQALDLGFAYYRDFVKIPRKNNLLESMIARISEFNRLSVSVEALYEPAAICLQQGPVPYDMRTNLYGALSRVAQGVRLLPEAVVEGILDCLKETPERPDGQRRALLLNLGDVHQAQIWSLAFAQRAPPAIVRGEDGKVNARQLRFALDTFKPSMTSSAALDGFVTYLADALLEDGRIGLGIGYHFERPAIPANQHGNDLLYGAGGSPRLHDTVEVLLHALETMDPTLLAEFVNRLSRDVPDTIHVLLSRLRMDVGHRAKSLAFLSRLAPTSTPGEVTLAIAALVELGDLLQDPSGTSQVLAYSRLKQAAEEWGGGNTLYRSLRNQVSNGLRGMLGRERFAVAACYLSADRCRAFLDEALHALADDPGGIGLCIARKLPPWGTAGFLARVLKITWGAGGDFYERAWHLTWEALRRLSAGDCEAALLELNRHLEIEKAPRGLRADIRYLGKEYRRQTR